MADEALDNAASHLLKKVEKRHKKHSGDENDAEAALQPQFGRRL